MAKKSKVSVDDFAYFDEEEVQPLNLIAKSIQKTDSLHESKKKHSIMDGYFDEPMAKVEINPFVVEIPTSKTDNKEITNGYQSDNTAQIKQATNGQQTDNKEITELSSKIKTGNKQVTKRVTEQITMAPYSSSNNLNINTNTIELPESLRRFGISTVNLQALVTSGKTTQEVVERSLAALSFDVENGKTGNLANILFGVLGSGREYISQKYSESLQKELDEELVRIQRAEESQRKLTETKLQIRFRTFLNENPTFLEEIRGQHRGFVQTQELLEKMAFEEFKAREINL